MRELRRVRDPKLQIILKSIFFDDTRQAPFNRLQKWCRSRGSGKARPLAAPVTTTTTVPPTTTTLAPQPVVFDGSGDDVVQVTKPSEINVVAADYDGGSNFVIWSLDANQGQVSLLVNEIGSYHGVVPLDFLDTQRSAFLQIQASGPWHIEIRPALTLPRFDATFEGEGDNVVVYTGRTGIATLNNDGESNFVVRSYGSAGQRLLVNEIGPYSGRVPMSAGPAVIEVKSSGHWSIAVG